MNELALKVYQVDYEFICKNCLNPNLWEKTWNLFVYRDYVFTLNISSISVRENTISFLIELIKGNKRKSTYICYHRNTENYTVLIKQVNGAMFRLIEEFEEMLLKQSDEYREIEDSSDREYDLLKEIAEEFLYDNGVSNSEIRDIYIDNYISNNSKIETMKSNYLYYNKYKLLSEMYLVFTKAIEDKTRHEIVLNRLKNESEERINGILEELEEYKKNIEESDDDFIESLKDELESL